jgi:hypothetical protein
VATAMTRLVRVTAPPNYVHLVRSPNFVKLISDVNMLLRDRVALKEIGVRPPKPHLWGVSS